MNLHHDDSLINEIATAIRLSAEELQSGMEKLFGFALGTDDDVRGLFHVACTPQWVAEKKIGYPDIGYIFVEWQHSARENLFEPISAKFSLQADQVYSTVEAWGVARDHRFEVMVCALKKCRDEGVFAPDTLLYVSSTDPSDHLESMAMKAVDRLNDVTRANAFALALGYAKYRIKP